MELTIWHWVGFNVLVLALLAFDLGVLHKKTREIRVSEALLLSLGYFIIALIFGGVIFKFMGAETGYSFFTGYLIEKSLSLDNIFVFVLIFSHFSVPPQYQHRVLFWGILGALVMRGIMIYLGAALIKEFHWILYFFGAFLVLTSIKMLLAINKKPDLTTNRIVLFMQKHFRVTDGYHAERFFVRKGKQTWITPLFIVLVLIEITDLVFAVDSIPAIFAITHDPFIVYTSNVFAILGLRALYFALAGIIHRFHYLKYGLSLVLMLVGIKMLLNSYFGGKFIPVHYALLATAVLIFGSMALSLIKTSGSKAPASEKERQRFALGWVPGSKEKKD